MSFLNSAINKLPVELHLPGYSYCGPGTKLSKRLARGDSGINPLDRACKEHDIAYSNSSNLKDRHLADSKLAASAWERVKAKDSSLGERMSALGVAGAMKAKVKFGLGIKKKGKKKKQCSFKKVLSAAKKAIRLANPPTLKDAVNVAVSCVRKAKKASKVMLPKVIPISHKGGVLPLIPIFAGLSALGALAGGTSGIVSAVNKAQTAKKDLHEMKRHNKTMEAIAMGKGLYLAPYKTGSGLFLKPYSKN